jgi:uncharacterized protein (DUF1501 family)
VIADWPSLKAERLYQGRDLYPTADQLGLSQKTLAEVIFPDSAGAAPMKGLIA